MIILGEVRGDVKGILRSQQAFSLDLKALEQRVGTRIDTLEDRVSETEKNVSDLQSYRFKVAGFVFGVTIIATTFRDYIVKGLALISGG